MSISTKRQGLHATSAGTDFSNNSSYLEKHQDSLQEQVNQHTFQYPSLPVQNADMSTESSYQRNLRASKGYNYAGLQYQIYDVEEILENKI